MVTGEVLLDCGVHRQEEPLQRIDLGTFMILVEIREITYGVAIVDNCALLKMVGVVQTSDFIREEVERVVVELLIVTWMPICVKVPTYSP